MIYCLIKSLSYQFTYEGLQEGVRRGGGGGVVYMHLIQQQDRERRVGMTSLDPLQISLFLQCAPINKLFQSSL